MNAPAETRYARHGDVHIAYQSFGEGGTTLVLAPPIVSNLDMAWQNDDEGALYTRLASFARLVLWDKRGQGLSERDVGPPTLEDRVDDLLAVMDAEGIDQAVIGGVSEGGTTAAMFAATYPERTKAVVLFATFARLVQGEDYPIGFPIEVFGAIRDALVNSWGTAESVLLPSYVPSRANDDDFKAFFRRYEQACCTPSVLGKQLEWIRDVDIRAVLPQIQAPALVLHRAGDTLVPQVLGRYVADHLPNATFVDLAGADHVPWAGDRDDVASRIEAFVTEGGPARASDRALATVLCVGRSGATGTEWPLGEIGLRHRARVVEATDERLVATFDGPARAVRCALELHETVPQGRAGIHTGEIEVHGDQVGGTAIGIAADLSSHAQPGEVVVSNTVVGLTAGSGITFEERDAGTASGTPRSFAASVTAS